MNLLEKLRKHRDGIETVLKWDDDTRPSSSHVRLEDESMDDYRERRRLNQVWLKHRSDKNHINPKTGERYER